MGDLTRAPAVSESLAPLALLLGTWEGESRALWDPRPPLVFRERVTYDHVGKPHIRYMQQTWRDDGVASHGEMGYLIPEGGDIWRMTLAQPSGITEVDTGNLSGTRLELRSLIIGLSPTAKKVTAIQREIEFSATHLHYLLSIAMNGEPLARHIEGDLVRVG